MEEPKAKPKPEILRIDHPQTQKKTKGHEKKKRRERRKE